MELNEFGSKLIAQLARIANSAEALENIAKGGNGQSTAKVETGKAETAPKESAADKKARLAAEAEAAKAAAAPKATRPDVNKALVSLKDTISKEAAQAVYQKYGYTAMSKIEEKDFDAILADAEAALAAGAGGSDEEPEDDL